MCSLMYFKIQGDQPKITRNALKSEIFDLFTKSLLRHKDEDEDDLVNQSKI